MKVLSPHTSSKLKQRVHCLQTIFDHCPQLFPASFPRIDDLAQRYCLAGQVGRDRATEESLAVEDAEACACVSSKAFVDARVTSCRILPSFLYGEATRARDVHDKQKGRCNAAALSQR
jgi:hypothetical protein